MWTCQPAGDHAFGPSYWPVKFLLTGRMGMNGYSTIFLSSLLLSWTGWYFQTSSIGLCLCQHSMLLDLWSKITSGDSWLIGGFLNEGSRFRPVPPVFFGEPKVLLSKNWVVLLGKSGKGHFFTDRLSQLLRFCVEGQFQSRRNGLLAAIGPICPAISILNIWCFICIGTNCSYYFGWIHFWSTLLLHLDRTKPTRCQSSGASPWWSRATFAPGSFLVLRAKCGGEKSEKHLRASNRRCLSWLVDW